VDWQSTDYLYDDDYEDEYDDYDDYDENEDDDYYDDEGLCQITKFKLNYIFNE